MSKTGENFCFNVASIQLKKKKKHFLLPFCLGGGA